jgi:hypothetical protein
MLLVEAIKSQSIRESRTAQPRPAHLRLAEYPAAAVAAVLTTMLVSTGAVSKFNVIELITASEIHHAYAFLAHPLRLVRNSARRVHRSGDTGLFAPEPWAEALQVRSFNGSAAPAYLKMVPTKGEDLTHVLRQMAKSFDH